MNGDFSTGGVVHSDGTVSFGKGDDGLFVQFFPHAVHLEWQSKQEGRPIYEQRDYVRVIQPGERDKMEREAREDDKHRWPRQWAAYQSQQQQVPDGTPVDVLFPGAPHEVAMLKALHIHTIEMLAALGEAGISRLGIGGRNKVERAKRFLDAANGMAGMNKLQAENERMAEELAAIKAQMEQLIAAGGRDNAPRPRGRPRNDQSGADRMEEG
jgi:hypothetical protein